VSDFSVMKYDLEDRLILFASSVIDVIENLPSNRASNHLASQLIRSGTSPALSYGEAQSGESRRDFIHKMKVGLKELRETRICLKIIEMRKYLPEKQIESILKETNELISIFVKSISTARANLRKLGDSTGS
jgi:four helix bundle protein